MPNRRYCAAAFLLLGAVAGTTGRAGAQDTSAVRRVLLSVASTNDEWTTTRLRVNAGDMILVKADGLVRIGAYSGQADPSGYRAGTTDRATGGLLTYKIGVGAGKPAGKLVFIQAEESGELKFRVADSRYDDNAGAYEVDVVVIAPSAIPPAIRVSERP